MCGSNDAVELPHCQEYTGGQAIHICKGCGLVYVKKRRTLEEIARVWSEEIYGDITQSPSNYSARIPAVKARQTYLADLIDVNIGLKDKLVFDIGAGEGQFLKIIRDQYGALVYGVEPSQKNCRILKQMGMDYFQGTIEQFCARSTTGNGCPKADIVTIAWTLENCGSCRSMVSCVPKVLKEDGCVVIATASRILVPFKKPLGFYLSKNPVDTYAFRFSANTLRGLLAVCGFEVVYVNRYIDTDVLCMIAKMRSDPARIQWERDDYRTVYDFFERWHQESQFYHQEQIKYENR